MEWICICLTFIKNIIMRHRYKILLIAIWLCIHSTSAQNEDPRIALTAPVEVEIAEYIENNIDSYQLSTEELNSLQNDNEHEPLTTEELNNLVISIKKSRLRALYFEQNPEKKDIYQSKISQTQSRQACFDGGFEGQSPLAAYNFNHYNETLQGFNACQMNLQAGAPAQPPTGINDFNADYTIVSQGFDPFLSTQSINIPRTFNNSNQAIKLNANDGGRDVTQMTKQFIINENDLSINFSLILENPAGHDGPPSTQPFFRVRLYDPNGNVFYERCIVSDPSNCIFTPVGGVLYSNWRCLNINTESLMGQNTTLEFTIVDCGQNAHFGTVYIDEICNTTCQNSAFGDILLNPVGLNCPEESFQVCGSYLSPLCSTSLNDISLNLIDSVGIVNTLTNPIIDTINNEFCFTVNPGDFGLNPSGNFEFEAVVSFNTNTGFISVINDLSANVGADVSFNDCTDPCNDELNAIIPDRLHLTWDDIATSYDIEFVTDNRCAGQSESGVEESIIYEDITGNTIDLNVVWNDLFLLTPNVKAMRFRIKTDCGEWSDWCCIRPVSNPSPGLYYFENPYTECFPNNPCEDFSPITLTHPNDDVDANSGNADYIDYQNIIASNKIENNYTSEYRASEFIRLIPDFHAKQGSTFRASIQECVDIDIVTLPSSKMNDRIEALNDLKVYPNPAKDKINIVHDNLNIGSYTLYDIQGRIISQQNAINNTKHTINLSGFNNGMYILSIILEDNSTINRNIIIN